MPLAKTSFNNFTIYRFVTSYSVVITKAQIASETNAVAVQVYFSPIARNTEMDRH